MDQGQDQLHDKIVEAQSLAKNAIASVSAMINQDSADPDELKTVRDRLHQLSELLDTINEDNPSS